MTSLAGQDLSGSGFSNYHDGSLNVTGREVGMDTGINNELRKKGLASFLSKQIIPSHLPSYPLHKP